METQTQMQNTTDKNMAIIAYITVVGLIIAFISNKDKKDAFTSFHIKQSLGLALTGLALGIISLIPILGWIIWIIGVFVVLYMWVMGLMNAINGKEKTVPFLGDKYGEWFKNM
ncbi:hypothetical protein U1E44_14000 [Arenibacter sp. GZD96]|uniref:hypothetical protein n=1 Tax=Aurantibrevibacter litoralis TaxID=3106030 RepID=UPI002AFFB00D|nr:hypothetical protein [Arenibacter sp. GZD-96]MEA1787210.1 hypothetical protein [Arenibacter sp. GZD-96]